MELAIRAVNELYKDSRMLQAMALMVLAMVPVLGIVPELHERVKRFSSNNQLTEDDYLHWLNLADALRYLGSPKGDEELRKLKAQMESKPATERSTPLGWFDTRDDEWAKWKKDRAEGRRWYFEDEISD